MNNNNYYLLNIFINKFDYVCGETNKHFMRNVPQNLTKASKETMVKRKEKRKRKEFEISI